MGRDAEDIKRYYGLGDQLPEQGHKDRGNYEGEERPHGEEVVETEGEAFGDGDGGEDESCEQPVRMAANGEDGRGLRSVWGEQIPPD